MRIALIANQMNYSSGVSTYIISLASKLNIKNRVYVVTSGGTATELMDQLGINYLIIKELNFDRRNYLKFSIAAVKLGCLIHKKKFEILHSNDYYTANITRMANLFYKKAAVQTVHSTSTVKGKLNKYCADYFIFVNRHLLDPALNEFPQIISKSKIIFNGIDYTTKINCKKKYGEEKVNFSAAARLEYDKGIQNVIKAVAGLPDSYKGKVVLRIAGMGSYYYELKQLAGRLNVDAEFLGEIKGIDNLLSSTDIFIFSSLQDSFGLTLLEAAKYDCFIITSDFKGLENIFRNDIDGFIYKKESPEDLRQKIISAVDLNSKRNIYSENFKKRALEKFNLDDMVKQTEEIYNKCLSRY
jgi:glycosyltransferase involved in cell wall biosynthesis